MDYSKESLKAQHAEKKIKLQNELNKLLLEYYEHTQKTKSMEKDIHNKRCELWNIDIGRNR